jgi:hypothetical protein
MYSWVRQRARSARFGAQVEVFIRQLFGQKLIIIIPGQHFD